MEERIKQIEKKLRVQRLYTLEISAVLGLCLLFSFKTKEQVIRAKGIVIVDEQGRERILIGAPIPEARHRVRTNMDKAVEAWGEIFGKENFKKFYSKLDHSATGMVILDEKGFDRIAIGNTVPDPNIGRRIGKSTGVILNDEAGFERSGYGVLNVNGQNRVVLGLDREDGTEGAVMFLSEDGAAGISVRKDKKSLFLGNAAEGHFKTGMKEPFFGVVVRDTSAVKLKFNAEEK